MNYWWVNQKQTHSHEIANGDGYMWAPKRQSDGRKNFAYENMRQIRPGDIIFSYAKSAIIAIGIAKTHHYSFPKPIEFGTSGVNWSSEGWKVDVKYTRLISPIRTIDHIDDLRALLPDKYSPLKHNTGYGNQAYLFRIDKFLSLALAKIIGQFAIDLISSTTTNKSDYQVDKTIDNQIDEWENRIQEDILTYGDLRETEKQTLIRARICQGEFRSKVLNLEPRCRVTGVGKARYLIASHIKPWRSSTNREKLDQENGLMLTPTIDHLFDKGYISFENNGKVIIADLSNRRTMAKMGVTNKPVKIAVPAMSSDKKNYLDWHRENVLL